MPPNASGSGLHGQAADVDLLAALFGLERREAETFGEVVEVGLAARGLDGTVFMEELKAGKPVGAALGLPDALADAVYDRACRWFSAGRPERAEPLFRALCTLDGRVADFWVAYGVSLRACGRLSFAEIAFAVAARLRPNWALPYFHLADVFAVQHRLDAARTTLDVFFRLNDATIPVVVVDQAKRLQTVVSALGQRP
ncbi:hypothetical protein [Rhizobium oryzicola]|uniref:Tetratricopeptide repeat protein n=1 Tax=Rhizobium oryzicola TaxID=1232668 RepID=A0ABT8SXR3_9HYPH|nr:hypothetical protein [Rhizobium oryzicola]MDO1583210.1 hypothetical protein [Rhizobium oryzicola]